MDDDLNFIRGRLRGLLAIATEILPREVVGTREHGEWLVTGPAFVARAARSLEAIAHLMQKRFDTDGYVVLRTLYETIVRFAWIAADPTARMPRWLKWDRLSRLNAEQALANVGDPRLMPAETRAIFEQESNAVDQGMPSLQAIVGDADSYWSSRINSHGGPSTPYGLSGLYRILYAHTSAIAHGNAMALQSFVGSKSPGVLVVLSGELIGEDQPYGLATVVFTMALRIFEQAFAVPGITEKLEKLVDAYPDPR